MMDELKEILAVAINAPSGDNCQPWRFSIDNGTVRIYNCPERDTSLFNYRQRASFVALGALLENILIAASAMGYKATLIPFPPGSEPDLVAVVQMERSTPVSEPLFDQITLRTTNRKRFEKMTILAEQVQALESAANAVGSGQLKLIKDNRDVARIADIISLNDRLVFENPYLHGFLFDHIRWNDEEASQTRDGLDIKTLELAPLDSAAFKLLKKYALVEVLNLVGISRIIAGAAHKLAMSAAAIGIVTIPGANPADYLNGGRIMQRVWLEATRLGLSFQLMTGITFLMQKVAEGSNDGLSVAHVGLIRQAHEQLKDLCGAGRDTIAVMFRVGKSSPPSARSLRVPVDELITD